MLEIKDLRAEKRKLLTSKGGSTTYKKEDGGATVYVAYHIGGERVGVLEMYHLKDEDIWVMDYISSKIKGLGKHLVYDAMNKIYPNWLCIDREMVSRAGAHLWGKLGQVYYIEQGFLPERLRVSNNGGEKPNEYGINTMFRYSRKTALNAVLSYVYSNKVDYSNIGEYNPNGQECVNCGEEDNIMITHFADICHNCGYVYT